MSQSVPCLRTLRLELVPFRSEHAADLHSLYQGQDVLRYFPNSQPPPLEKLQRFVAQQLEHWAAQGYGNWIVQGADQGEVMGWAGLWFVPELGQCEVGYLLGRPFWGKGFATEAARACLDFAFGHARLEQVIGLVHPENLASRRVLEKCGLRYVETIFLWGLDLMRYQREHAASPDSGIS